jgi:hypothetical protein
MKFLAYAVLAAAAMFAALNRARTCTAHGTPIIVNVDAGRLVVSNGVQDDRGYADWVFADPDPEAWLAPGPGPSQFSTLPGFNVNDMLAGEELSLEILSRPDFTRAERPERWLWYWDASDDAVELAASNSALSLVSTRGFLPSVDVLQENPPTPTSLEVMVLQPGDIAQHRHTILYQLDDSTPAEAGVWAFFARVTSPSYSASEPFLVALNNGLEDETSYLRGGLVINAAARLPGDFDGDDNVDGADFLLWQRTVGSTTSLAADATLDGVVNGDDLAIWREGFGDVAPPAAGATGSVPEPTAKWLAILLALGILQLTFRSPPLDGEG